jgi:poly-gamma-glutamate capsule biosynthesis protein CapA/YwtB (metallophosphatase superfamily)
MTFGRRRLVLGSGAALVGAFMPSAAGATPAPASDPLRLFLCGDVMTARGIDQVLPHPGDPELHEPYVKDARRYVELAERVHGPIPKPVPFSYIWGDADETLAAADLRVINLETAVTQVGSPASKGIHYRMHPDNLGCLREAGIDCCVLANNHVLDWGPSGLLETLDSLRGAGLRTAGAGKDQKEAAAPAILESQRGRVLVFGYGRSDSGIPPAWAAGTNQPGLNLVSRDEDVSRLAAAVRALRKPNDIVVLSVHWGGNWGYAIPQSHRRLAHRVIEEAGVDLVHGHSSHHVKGIEVHRGKLILYGCGDFINDYEGIGGHESYRADLVLGYVASVRPLDGTLQELRMAPFQMHRFALRKASERDRRFLRDLIAREGKGLGTSAGLDPDGAIKLRW